jgi:hypothetical protein
MGLLKPITVDDLRSCLTELNEKYPRPGMAPLALSELCDSTDSALPWPHAGNPGVYALFDANRELLYIGKASCNRTLGQRLRAHFNKNGAAKSQAFASVGYIATIPVPTDRAFEAPAIEEFLIARLNPSLCSIARSYPLLVEADNQEDVTLDNPGDCGTMNTGG